jgi:hypothetical protein
MPQVSGASVPAQLTRFGEAPEKARRIPADENYRFLAVENLALGAGDLLLIMPFCEGWLPRLKRPVAGWVKVLFYSNVDVRDRRSARNTTLRRTAENISALLS